MKIALTGKMRSGKDSIADYAIDNYGFTRFAFGDGIKKVCRELFPDKMTTKNRSLLQNFGQMMRYEFDEQVWVNYCFNQIEGSGITSPIITDLRQPNEHQRCTEEGFIIVKVETDDEIRLQRINAKGDNFTLNDLNHETEMHIDILTYEYVINNNGSLVEAFEQFDNIVSDIVG